MDERLDALRRAVYAPGAGEAERARYADALREAQAAAAATPLAEPQAPVLPGPDDPHDADPRRPRRRRPAVITIGTVVVLVLAGVGVVRSLPGPTPDPAPRVDYDLATKRALVRQLERGAQAGILEDLAQHPEHASAALRATDVVASSEVFGRGDMTVRLDTLRPVPGAGRATVIVVLADAASVRWTAMVLRRSIDGPRPFVVQRAAAARQVTGTPRTRTSPYRAGDAPTFLRVEVPNDVRWGAAVLYTTARGAAGDDGGAVAAPRDALATGRRPA